MSFSGIESKSGKREKISKGKTCTQGHCFTEVKGHFYISNAVCQGEKEASQLRSRSLQEGSLEFGKVKGFAVAKEFPC